jgi:superfamily II DNA or RNA helicase
MKKKNWLPFHEAQAFVHTLGMTSEQQWYDYSRSGQRPSDIPARPDEIFQAEWLGWSNWLGEQNQLEKRRLRSHWRPFEQARASVHALGLVTVRQWKEYSKSGQRPSDIPAMPDTIYGTQWQGWHDWLGKPGQPEKRKPKGGWRPFEQARAYAHALGLVTAQQWYDHSKSGQRPSDIPATPDKVYPAQWQGWHDWLGVQHCQRWRPFAQARAFVRELGLTNRAQWLTYCSSGQRPSDIPTTPDRVYAGQWQGLNDWLGKPTQIERRKPKSGWRPFEQARAYAHTLGLTTIQQWYQHCASGKKPLDIPSTPDQTYRGKFRGWKDWLNKKTWRPFEDARAFVRALNLKSKVQWEEYCQSGEKPSDIPSSPSITYRNEFRGYQDWLGNIHIWNKNALLSLLQDIRKNITSLQENELYTILDRSGALSGFCAVLQTKSAQHVFRDLIENDGEMLEAQLMLSSHEADLQPLRIDDSLGNLPHQWPPVDLSLVTEEELHALDKLPSLSRGLDEEMIEYLIANRVSSLWECVTNEGEQRVEALLSRSGDNRYFEEIKRRFLAEKYAVEMLPIPPGWTFTDDQGNACAPNLMQRRIAWMVRERGRVGNWSGVGTGKTLSAILASRVIDAKLTLLLVANPTIDQWEEQIKNAYSDSIVYRDISEVSEVLPDQHVYLLLNYEKFQGESRGARVAALVHLCPDFVVFDEIQCVKQRGKEMSQRREALEMLMQALPSCVVLGMSATPVINDLTEAQKILELIIGLPLTEVGVRSTVSNALAMHRLLLFHGIRNHPVCKQDLAVKIFKARRNDLREALLQGGNNLLKIEQILLPAKLEVARPYFRKGILVYTQYIDNIVDPIQQYLEQMGFKVGRFIGTEKGGLEAFKHGDIDVLIGSPAVCTGIDGLQKISDRIVMLSLPWTHAAYEQIVGRVRRQGSSFPRTEIIIPQIILQREVDTWSWDERRHTCIEFKRTLSDCVLEGVIPETTQINQQKFLQQSYEALEQWIERVERAERSSLFPKPTIVRA